MPNIYRSARGERIDMDLIRLTNEDAVAIGNMRTNARGDELGPGGKIIKTRAEIMAEYHKLNTPVADDTPITKSHSTLESDEQRPMDNLVTPLAVDTPIQASINQVGQEDK